MESVKKESTDWITEENPLILDLDSKIKSNLTKIGKYDVCRAVEVIKQHQQRRERVCILPHISIKTATALKDLGYKLSPRLMDKNEEFYYKVYLV